MTREELLQLIDKAADEGSTELDLAGLGLEELPPEIGKCTQLESLVLGKMDKREFVDGKVTPKLITNQLSTLPEELRSLENLRSINLSGNPFGKMPELLMEMKQLESLDLTSIGLTEIPDAICQLSNLKKLFLNNNQITPIPEAICQLSNLTGLVLGSNQITQIPEVIGQLSNLTWLGLGDNQITKIPDAIGQLSNLTWLQIWKNQITQIPEAISQLSNLTRLDLSNNQITEIPEAVGQLSSLTMIFLYSNQIAKIPEAIGQLSDLTWLFLWENQITKIPDAIAQLSNLTVLYLNNNQITVIPEFIAQLSNLTDLSLSNNQIEKIPECLETLSKLENLDLRNNSLPIFNYLRQLRSGEVLPLNEAKVLLVGQGSVGKTSLINRLTHNQYNPNQPQTDGLNITNWKITVNTKPVKLNVWDFGGQEIYHATHQFFLTKRSLYLLVSNCRTSEDENRLEYWLKLIESFGDASPVILIGNKCDEQPLDLNRKALRDKYPNIKAIIETSCQNGTGIDELRSAIHTEISQLKEVYDLLPLSWFQVKQRLENLDKDFISISEYATICATENIL
ncbi:MAG: GTP-binding protein, partial [Oscillatoriales cyanobacterium]